MDPNLDSRTESFSLKRPYAEAAHCEGSVPSSPITPRKRVRVDDENVHNGRALVSPEDAPTASPEDREFSIKGRAAEPQEEHNPVVSQSMPSMNWNTGSKTKIRVSLRDRAAGSNAADIPLDPATTTTPAAIAGTEEQTPVVQRPAEIDVSEILANLPKKVKNQFKSLVPHGRAAVAEGRRLFVGNLDSRTTKLDIRDLFGGFSITRVTLPHRPEKPRLTRYALVDLTKPNEASRAVSQLNGGGIVGRQAVVQLVRDKSRTESGQDTTAERKDKDSEADQSGKESALEHDSNETAVILDVNRSKAVSVQLQKSPPTSGRYENGSAVLFELPPGRAVSEKNLSGTDTGGEAVVLNIQDDSDQESGEITDSDSREKKTDQHTFDGVVETDHSSLDSASDYDNDAMMAYADSGASNGGISHGYTTSNGHTRPHQPQILAHLQQKELALQLRYFYVAKVSQDVDLDDPVHCLICAEKGHMAAVCEALDCNRCGEQDAHSTQNCPLIILPSGAKRSQATICELCECKGHLPDECELFWRTSGGPWHSDLSDMKIRFECYECGRRDHLGNDCPFRRPGKPHGSSSWTYPGKKKPAAKKSNQGISIKGRAHQTQPPIIIDDDSDEDSSNFRRPKVAAPARPGQINIRMGGNQNTVNDRPDAYSNVRTENGRNYYSDSRNRDGARRSPPMHSAYPRHSPYGHPSANRQPPLPPGPPPYDYSGPRDNRAAKGLGNARPMPSAGQKAWRQFRK
ncbi:MAG: hypothetical protein Q9169_006110 [Polycauliona sp. 2 TL-2023]